MEFTLHRSFKDLEPLAAEWNALLKDCYTHVPFLRHEYLRTWWETRGGGEWPDSELAVVAAHRMGGWQGWHRFFLPKIEREPGASCCSAVSKYRITLT